MAVSLELIIYSPSDLSNIIEVWLIPLIIFLQFPNNLKVPSFWIWTILFLLIFITAHSPSVVKGSSKSFNFVLSMLIIFTSFLSLVIIIGAFFSEDKCKFFKYNFTESDLITIFPYFDSLVTK